MHAPDASAAVSHGTFTPSTPRKRIDLNEPGDLPQASRRSVGFRRNAGHGAILTETRGARPPAPSASGGGAAPLPIIGSPPSGLRGIVPPWPPAVASPGTSASKCPACSTSHHPRHRRRCQARSNPGTRRRERHPSSGNACAANGSATGSSLACPTTRSGVRSGGRGGILTAEDEALTLAS